MIFTRKLINRSINEDNDNDNYKNIDKTKEQEINENGFVFEEDKYQTKIEMYINYSPKKVYLKK